MTYTLSIIRIICTRQSHSRRQGCRSALDDVDVRAAGVELRPEALAGDVQAEDLVAEEVGARSEAARDGDVPLGTALTEEVRGPGLAGGVRVVGELADLDPHGARVALEGRAVVVGAACDVVEDGAAVGAVPLVPEESPRDEVKKGTKGGLLTREGAYTVWPALTSMLPCAGWLPPLLQLPALCQLLSSTAVHTVLT